MVEDTLNLIRHSRKKIKVCIIFIRKTLLIRVAVYEILRVFVKMAAIFRINSQYLVNGESDPKSVTNKKAANFNFLSRVSYQF